MATYQAFFQGICIWICLGMHNVSRFRLRAHTLTVETASWRDGISLVCDRCSFGQIQDEAHVLFKI
eukprot:464976-Pelagomonas_calceolata.AAC.1